MPCHERGPGPRSHGPFEGEQRVSVRMGGGERRGQGGSGRPDHIRWDLVSHVKESGLDHPTGPGEPLMVVSTAEWIG